MLIDESSLYVNGVNLIPYMLNDYKYGSNKIWASDAGRNTVSGAFSGTFVGIFPKIQVQFRSLTRAELEYLTPILDSAFQEVIYYDPYLQRLRTMRTYSGDWELSQRCLFSDVANAGRPFSISFIATDARS